MNIRTPKAETRSLKERRNQTEKRTTFHGGDKELADMKKQKNPIAERQQGTFSKTGE